MLEKNREVCGTFDECLFLKLQILNREGNTFLLCDFAHNVMFVFKLSLFFFLNRRPLWLVPGLRCGLLRRRIGLYPCSVHHVGGAITGWEMQMSIKKQNN